MEMTNNNSNGLLNRRRFLAAVGSGATASVLPTVGSARPLPPQARYRRALAVRQATGNNDVFREELRNQGATISAQNMEFSAPWEDPERHSGELTTLSLDQADCSLELTLACFSDFVDYIYADLYWEHDVGYTLFDNDAGEPPYDIVGLSFEERDYDLVSGSWYGGNNTSKRQYNNAGVAFNYCDACCEEYEDATGDCTPQGESFTISDYCGMRIKPDETSDPDYRNVYADYWHTYQSVTVDGVSISSSGEVSVRLSNEEKKWLKEDDANEGDARSS